MALRRNFLQDQDEGFPGRMRHGPSAADPVENKLASQAAEIDRLAVDNHKLATSHLALRQNLVGAQQEADKLRAHIRTLRSEGDIQICILLDKIGKLEANVRAGDSMKKESQETHFEAQSLVKSAVELAAQVKQATQNLDNARADVKKLPEMHVELGKLRQDHQRLRQTFEYEKGINVENVEEMKILEKEVVAIAEEVERLRAEVLIVENKATGRMHHGGANNLLHPPQWHGQSESYGLVVGGAHLHMGEGMNLYPAVDGLTGGFEVPINGVCHLTPPKLRG